MPARTPHEIHAQIAAAISAGDRDAFADLHEEGATVVVPTDGRPVTGRDALVSAIEPLLAQRPNLEIELVGMLEHDDLALGHGRWSLVGSDGVERSGRGTMVSRRQPDGTWRIVFDNPLSHA